VADLTYIRLRGEFLYLAVILDRFSRSVVGWSLARMFHTGSELVGGGSKNSAAAGPLSEVVTGRIRRGTGFA